MPKSAHKSDMLHYCYMVVYHRLHIIKVTFINVYQMYHTNLLNPFLPFVRLDFTFAMEGASDSRIDTVAGKSCRASSIAVFHLNLEMFSTVTPWEKALSFLIFFT